MTLADELIQIAGRAADAMREASAPSMTIYELAEALRYCVADDCSEDESVDQARTIFEHAASLRDGTERPDYFARQLALERAEKIGYKRAERKGNE